MRNLFQAIDAVTLIQTSGVNRLERLLATLFFLLLYFASPAYGRVLSVHAFVIKLQNHYQYQQLYSGRLSSVNQSELGFELPPTESGTLTEINVDVGYRFKKGDVLAKLDDRLLKKKAGILQARVREINSNIELAEKTLKRQQDLQRRDYSSKQSLDEALAQLERLQHQHASMQQELDEVNIRLDKMRLIAPFDGVVTERMVSKGSIIRSGQVILNVIDNQHLQAKIGVPARYLSLLKQRQAVEILVDGQSIKGRIDRISPRRNPVTQSHEVLISTQEKTDLNLENVLASIVISVQIQATGAWVPVSALQQHYRGLWTVYALKKQQQYFRVHAKPVQVLYMNAKSAFIQGNLHDGEHIVQEGLLRIVPGERVQVVRNND